MSKFPFTALPPPSIFKMEYEVKHFVQDVSMLEVVAVKQPFYQRFLYLTLSLEMVFVSLPKLGVQMVTSESVVRPVEWLEVVVHSVC